MKWNDTSWKLPEMNTPVLLLRKGEIRIGELRESKPEWDEFQHEPYKYWDDPTNDGQDWAWEWVTHWMELPKKPDGRYTIAYEWKGVERPQHVLRFCGDFVSSHRDRKLAAEAQEIHNNERTK